MDGLLVTTENRSLAKMQLLFLCFLGPKGSTAEEFRRQGVRVNCPGIKTDSCKVQFLYYDDSSFEVVQKQILELCRVSQLFEEELVEVSFPLSDQNRGKLIGTQGSTIHQLNYELQTYVEMPSRGSSDSIKVDLPLSRMEDLKGKLMWSLGFCPVLRYRRFGETTLQQWHDGKQSEGGTKRKWSEMESTSTKRGPKKKPTCSQIPLLIDNMENKMEELFEKQESEMVELEEKLKKQRSHYDEIKKMFTKQVQQIREEFDQEREEERRANAEELNMWKEKYAKLEEDNKEMKVFMRQAYKFAAPSPVASTEPLKSMK